MNKKQSESKFFLEKIQAPNTISGKSFRDAFFAVLSVGILAMLQSLDAVDFGEYESVMTAIIAFLIALINRKTRKIKRELE